MNYSNNDFMKLALEEAEISYNRGDLPVGAVLTIDNKLIGKDGNSATTNEDWFSHAEASVLNKYSRAIKTSKKIDKNTEIILYSSWEPCLMCTSIASLCRVDKIIYSCPDPIGGVSKFNPNNLPDWYNRHWPIFERGLYEKESYNLLIKYMENNIDIWGDFIQKFKI
ncbi:MAG: deaminase [Nanoarchaeota archaeon]|nr:deaminase [Nanoarchaeota archaeon]